MKKIPKRQLTKNFLVALGIPAIFIPGLILASILGWSWRSDLARIAAKGGFYQATQLFPQKAIVSQAIDGDTLLLSKGRVVRMVGIDAPDRGEALYDKALEYSLKMAEGKRVKLEYDQYQDDKFGRILAYVWVPCVSQKGCRSNKIMLNQALVSQGLARVVIYSKRKKLKHQDQLFQAEQRAKAKKLGIWGLGTLKTKNIN